MSGPSLRNIDGVPVYMTDYEYEAFMKFHHAIKEAIGYFPRVMQGPWQSVQGHPAEASAHYHDFAGCVDTRRIDSAEDRRKWHHIARSEPFGFPEWDRGPDLPGHFDAYHNHLIIPTPANIKTYSGVRWQVADYKDGGNGLGSTSHGPDYHWRPDPIVIYEGDNVDLNDRLWPNDDSRKATVRTALRQVILQGERDQKYRQSMKDTIKDLKTLINDNASPDEVQNLLDSLEYQVTVTMSPVIDPDPASDPATQ